MIPQVPRALCIFIATFDSLSEDDKPAFFEKYKHLFEPGCVLEHLSLKVNVQFETPLNPEDPESWINYANTLRRAFMASEITTRRICDICIKEIPLTTAGAGCTCDG